MYQALQNLPSSSADHAPVETCEFVNEHTAAAILGKATQTLRQWRVRRLHLPFHRVAGSVKYRLSDVLTFRESGRVEPRA